MINDIICLNFPLNKTNNALSLPQRLMVVNHNYAVRIAYTYIIIEVNLLLDSYMLLIVENILSRIDGLF